jgi:acetyl-CoA acyltransferase
MSRRVFLAGGHITPFIGKGNPAFIHKKHPDFGKKLNPTVKDYIVQSIQGAFTSTGVSGEAIDRVYVGNFAGELFNQQGHLGAAVAAADPALLYKPSMRVEGACASGGLACAEAVRAIRAGDDTVLAVGVEVQTDTDSKTGASYLARAADFHREVGIDAFTFPCLFARRTKHYLAAFPDASLADIGLVAAKAYANGNANPLAHMHAVKVSAEYAGVASEKNPCFLGNEDYKSFLRLTDCSQVSDGGAAAIFCSEDGLRAAGLSPADAVEVVDADYGCGDLWSTPDNLEEMTTTKTVVRRLLARAGVAPTDLQVAEVHDCFALTEILMYEAIGIAGRGEGPALVRSGATARDGKIPVNTGGGLLSFGHPVGATGVKQVLEIYRQMKGKCGDYQMAAAPSLGLTVNMGGDDKTCSAMLLRNL